MWTEAHRACHEACVVAEAESLLHYAIRGPGDVGARMFDRFDTIGEDPATGSAVGPLGAYLAEHALAGMPGSMVVAQGEATGRPSFLHVAVDRADDAWTIDVEGGVRIVGRGEFEI